MEMVPPVIGLDLDRDGRTARFERFPFRGQSRSFALLGCRGVESLRPDSRSRALSGITVTLRDRLWRIHGPFTCSRRFIRNDRRLINNFPGFLSRILVLNHRGVALVARLFSGLSVVCRHTLLRLVDGGLYPLE